MSQKDEKTNSTSSEHISIEASDSDSSEHEQKVTILLFKHLAEEWLENNAERIVKEMCQTNKTSSNKKRKL